MAISLTCPYGVVFGEVVEVCGRGLLLFTHKYVYYSKKSIDLLENPLNKCCIFARENGSEG